MLSREYKKKFQLPLGASMVAQSSSKLMSDATENRDQIKYLKPKYASKKGVTARKKNREYLTYFKNNASFHNKHGICDKQIESRFIIVADMVGREPTTTDLRDHDPKLLARIIKRYGNLNKFRKEKGFKVVPRKIGYTQESIMASIRLFVEEHGRLPYQKDFRGKKPSVDSIRNVFGSFSKAIIASGFDIKE